MRLLLISLTMFLFVCCEKQQIRSEKIKYFYLSYFQNQTTIDTVKYEEIAAIDSKDELLETKNFQFKGVYHQIKFYTSDNHSIVDGGSLSYTLDSFGKIYECSTTWPNFGRLSTNNDSINDLINVAIGYIIMNPSLHCYHCDSRNNHIPKSEVPEVIKY